MELHNSPEFASLPPNVIVPMQADKGVYIDSESTFYRVLQSACQLTANVSTSGLMCLRLWH